MTIDDEIKQAYDDEIKQAYEDGYRHGYLDGKCTPYVCQYAVLRKAWYKGYTKGEKDRREAEKDSKPKRGSGT